MITNEEIAELSDLSELELDESIKFEKSDVIGLIQGYLGALVMYFLLYYNPLGMFR